MRTYGRFGGEWIVITTDPFGYNDQVYLTTMMQVLKLNPGESPFYGNYGVPAQRSVTQQIFPDYYTSVVQQQFASYFTSLQIARIAQSPPMYRVNVIAHNGATFETQIQGTMG